MSESNSRFVSRPCAGLASAGANHPASWHGVQSFDLPAAESAKSRYSRERSDRLPLIGHRPPAKLNSTARKKALMRAERRDKECALPVFHLCSQPASCPKTSRAPSHLGARGCGGLSLAPLLSGLSLLTEMSPLGQPILELLLARELPYAHRLALKGSLALDASELAGPAGDLVHATEVELTAPWGEFA